jgi:hypothetical protein
MLHAESREPFFRLGPTQCPDLSRKASVLLLRMREPTNSAVPSTLSSSASDLFRSPARAGPAACILSSSVSSPTGMRYSQRLCATSSFSQFAQRRCHSTSAISASWRHSLLKWTCPVDSGLCQSAGMSRKCVRRALHGPSSVAYIIGFMVSHVDLCLSPQSRWRASVVDLLRQEPSVSPGDARSLLAACLCRAAHSRVTEVKGKVFIVHCIFGFRNITGRFWPKKGIGDSGFLCIPTVKQGSPAVLCNRRHGRKPALPSTYVTDLSRPKPRPVGPGRRLAHVGPHPPPEALLTPQRRLLQRR